MINMATKQAARKTTATKTTSKAAPAIDNKRWAKVQLPEGYEAITADNYGEKWDYEENPLLVGVVAGDVREVTTGSGRSERTSKVVTIIEEGTGHAIDVWESAGLLAWLEQIKKDDEVAIAFHGYRDVGKQSPMKVFVASIRAASQKASPASRRRR